MSESNISLCPANAAVWEDDAIWPLGVTPPLKTTIGLFISNNFKHICSNSSIFFISSKYKIIAFVVSSLYRYSKKWLSCKTALFPTLINLLIPKFLLFRNLTTPIVNPPLCEIMEIFPCFGRYLVANEAFRL